MRAVVGQMRESARITHASIVFATMIDGRFKPGNRGNLTHACDDDLMLPNLTKDTISSGGPRAYGRAGRIDNVAYCSTNDSCPGLRTALSRPLQHRRCGVGPVACRQG
jgi:hypothetical protein